MTREEFERRVRVDANGCWYLLTKDCTRTLTPDPTTGGYIKVRDGGKLRRAHHVAYETFIGPIPDGLDVLHEYCDNPPCCNPAHLCAGTHQDNMDHKVQKGRQHHPTGKRNPNTKLTDDMIRAIRADARKPRFIKRDYGLSKAALYAIQHGWTWAHVTDD